MSFKSLRPGVDQALVVMVVARAATDKFDRHNWLELATLCGRLDVVEGHDRLLRSLYFGDEDYPGHAFEVVRVLLGPSLQHFDTAESYIGLRSWLASNDRPMHDKLYGASPGSRILPEPDLASLRDPAAIEDQMGRMRRGLDDGDLSQAIGSAKDLIEATAKTVLNELGIDFHERDDVPALARAVQKTLGLHPDVIAPTRPGAEAVRKILGGLTAISTGIAELRNHYGTGHGRGHTVLLEARHAELAVDASVLYCRTVLAALADPGAPWKRSAEPEAR